MKNLKASSSSIIGNKMKLFLVCSLLNISFAEANFGCMAYGDSDNCTGNGCAWTTPANGPSEGYCWDSALAYNGSNDIGSNLEAFLNGSVPHDRLTSEEVQILDEFIMLREKLIKNSKSNEIKKDAEQFNAPKL